jgi:hypothetical protein
VKLSGLSAERERQLMEDARLALERVRELPRVTGHGLRLELLRGAESAVREAEALTEGVQYKDALDLTEVLAKDEARFSVAADGAVVAVKPSGTSYTELARDVVEWMLERELVYSGEQFPMSSKKTSDERAWAAFLAGAAARSRSEGEDFASVLASESAELTLRFPDPADYFAD